MIIDFFKMQGQGNDYIFIDLRTKKYPLFDPEKLAKILCDRHFSIGADGIVLISNSCTADIRMDMYNADGSRGRACGTAFRCLTHYIHLSTDQTVVTIETEVETVTGEIPNIENPALIKVKMGKPVFLDEKIYNIEGYKGKLVNIGNLHFITFLDRGYDFERLKVFGPVISQNPDLPAPANVSFVRIIDKARLEIWFWELGSGATLACGSGASAAVFSAIRTKNILTKVNVIVPGGELTVEYRDENIYLTGLVALSFSGKVQV